MVLRGSLGHFNLGAQRDKRWRLHEDDEVCRHAGRIALPGCHGECWQGQLLLGLLTLMWLK